MGEKAWGIEKGSETIIHVDLWMTFERSKQFTNIEEADNKSTL
jgi:hypothetical protein